MATAVTPSSRMAASRACSSGASGVVRAPDSVPSTSARSPAASKIDAQQVRGRRLAVGAGDPDHGHRRGPDRRGSAPTPSAIASRRVGHDDLGTPPRRAGGRRAAPPRPRHRLGGVVVAVAVLAAEAAEQAAGLHGARVERDRRDLDRRRAGRRLVAPTDDGGGRHGRGELGEQHGPRASASSAGPWSGVPGRGRPSCRCCGPPSAAAPAAGGADAVCEPAGMPWILPPGSVTTVPPTPRRRRRRCTGVPPEAASVDGGGMWNRRRP